MKKLFSLITALFAAIGLFAQEEATRGVDQIINDIFGFATGWFVNIIFYQIPITKDVSLFWVLIPLVLGATWFTIKFAFPGFRYFGTAINTVRGKYDKAELYESDLNVNDGDNPDTIRVEGAGEVSHFQALTAALSATVGLGNIAGVAVAVVIGGAGATFWMILCGLLGMASKFVECTLGVKYREVNEHGKVYGGPMYYLSKGLKEKNMGGLGKVLAVLFAIMCIGGSFGGGNMFQANQAYSIFETQLQKSIAPADNLDGKVLRVKNVGVHKEILQQSGLSYAVSSQKNEDGSNSFFLKNSKLTIGVDSAAVAGLSGVNTKAAFNGQSVNFPANFLQSLIVGQEGREFEAGPGRGNTTALTSMSSGTTFNIKRATINNSMNINRLYGKGWLFGLIMSLLVAVVIIGGIKRIANVTDKIVPIMAGIYVLAALVILLLNISYIPAAFGAIFSEAFAPTAVAGGFIGVLVQGFKRAAFSNEAGIGSAAIAHSAVKTKNPASEGIVALLEPFIDTVVICTMTALVIVITSMKGDFLLGNMAAGNAGDGAMVQSVGYVLEGVDLTSFAFNSTIPYFSIILTIAVILFAFSTMISWSYYGLQSWTYLFGKSNINEIIYKILFCLFVIIGSASAMSNVLNFSDAMIFAMMVPNMVGLVLLAPVVKKELDKYLTKIRKIED